MSELFGRNVKNELVLEAGKQVAASAGNQEMADLQFFIECRSANRDMFHSVVRLADAHALRT